MLWQSVSIVFLAFLSRVCQVPLKLIRDIAANISDYVALFQKPPQKLLQGIRLFAWTLNSPRLICFLHPNFPFHSVFSISYYCQLSLASALSGPALHCLPPFCFSDLLFLISCRLKFYHLEYFDYPKVTFLASSIIRSTRQEPESKTHPPVVRDAAAS